MAYICFKRYRRDKTTILKNKKAVALKYDKKAQNRAPEVVAKGKNLIAQKIEEIAHSSGVYVEKNEKLADELYKLNVSDEIPKELYEAVAKILTFVYGLNS